MINEGERGDPSERRKGNLNLVYTITHTFKHTIWGTEGYNWDTDKNKRRDIQVEAMSVLWTLKDDPRYLAYPDSPDYRLGDLLGDFPPSGQAVQELARSGENQEALYGYAKLSQESAYGGASGEPIAIPNHDTVVKKGLLTDVVSASGKRILLEAMQEPYYQSVLSARAERAGVSTEDFQKYVLAWLDYNLYTIGYLFPKIEEGTKAEEILQEQKLAIATNLPFEKIEELYGINIERLKD
jgi:hypothetical protein